MKRRIISVVALVLVVAMLSAVLIACAPGNMDDAEKKLKDKGFEVMMEKNSGSMYFVKKDNKAIEASAVFYTDKEKQKKAWIDAEAQYKKYEKEYKAKNWVVKKNGKWIAMGHKDAVSALF